MQALIKLYQFIKNILAWLIKNTALLVGIVEAFAKAFAGIISLCPVKSKDKLLVLVNTIASNIKKVLYTISDKLNGTKYVG